MLNIHEKCTCTFKVKFNLVWEIENLLCEKNCDKKHKARIIELEDLLSVKRTVLKVRIEEIFELNHENDILKHDLGEKGSKVISLGNELLELEEENENEMLKSNVSELNTWIEKKRSTLDDKS